MKRVPRVRNEDEVDLESMRRGRGRGRHARTTRRGTVTVRALGVVTADRRDRDACRHVSPNRALEKERRSIAFSRVPMEGVVGVAGVSLPDRGVSGGVTLPPSMDVLTVGSSADIVVSPRMAEWRVRLWRATFAYERRICNSAIGTPIASSRPRSTAAWRVGAGCQSYRLPLTSRRKSSEKNLLSAASVIPSGDARPMPRGGGGERSVGAMPGVDVGTRGTASNACHARLETASRDPRRRIWSVSPRDA